MGKGRGLFRWALRQSAGTNKQSPGKNPTMKEIIASLRSNRSEPPETPASEPKKRQKKRNKQNDRGRRRS
jgi:hypothetical protein